MTKEKAIRTLNRIRSIGNGESEYKNDAPSIALDMAINALEHEPKLEKIKRIVNQWNNDASHSFEDMCKINEILKE